MVTVGEVLKNLDTLVLRLTPLIFTLRNNISSMRAPPLIPHLCLELRVFINIDWACSQDIIVSKCLSLTALMPCSLFIGHYAVTRSKAILALPLSVVPMKVAVPSAESSTIFLRQGFFPWMAPLQRYRSLPVSGGMKGCQAILAIRSSERYGVVDSSTRIYRSSKHPCFILSARPFRALHSSNTSSLYQTGSTRTAMMLASI